jgi:hypothetical protein
MLKKKIMFTAFLKETKHRFSHLLMTKEAMAESQALYTFKIGEKKVSGCVGKAEMPSLDIRFAADWEDFKLSTEEVKRFAAIRLNI